MSHFRVRVCLLFKASLTAKLPNLPITASDALRLSSGRLVIKWQLSRHTAGNPFYTTIIICSKPLVFVWLLSFNSSLNKVYVCLEMLLPVGSKRMFQQPAYHVLPYHTFALPRGKINFRYCTLFTSMFFIGRGLMVLLETVESQVLTDVG